MTRNAAEPLVVYDVRETPMRDLLGTAWHQTLLDWFAQERIDPRDIYRFEVYLVDCPSARVFEWARGADGQRYLVSGDEIARREPYDVILSSLPPVMPTLA